MRGEDEVRAWQGLLSRGQRAVRDQDRASAVALKCVDCGREVTTYILDKNNEPHCPRCAAAHLSKIADLLGELADRPKGEAV